MGFPGPVPRSATQRSSAELLFDLPLGLEEEADLLRHFAREAQVRREALHRAGASVQPQQVEADCLERPHGVVEALLHEVALHLEVGDDPPAPRLDRSITLSPYLFPFS